MSKFLLLFECFLCTCLPFVSFFLDFMGNILCYPYFEIIAHFKQAQLFISPLLSHSTQISSGLFQVSCLNMLLIRYKVLTRLFNKRSVFLLAVSCLTYFLFGSPQIPKMETDFRTMGFAVVYIFFLH